MFQRGFTLIEMVMTLAVMALLMFAVIPGISDWLDNTRIRNTAMSIQEGIETARNEAVRRNQPVSFWLVSTSNPSQLDNGCALIGTSPSWMVSVSSPAGQCGNAASTTTAPQIVIGRAAGSDGTRVAVNALQSDGATAGTTVAFNGFGRPANGATGAISSIDVTGNPVTTSQRPLRITISGSGQVHICDPKVTDSNDPRKC